MHIKLQREIGAELTRQNEKFGGASADDARKTPENWCNDIEAYVVWARQMHRMGCPEKYRRRMLQVAALAVAACESFDRLTTNANVTGTPERSVGGSELT